MKIIFLAFFVAHSVLGNEVQTAISKFENEIRDSKKISEITPKIETLKKELRQLELSLVKKEKKVSEEVIGYNLAMGPIFDADFEKNKMVCTEDGVKREIVDLYHGRSQKMPPHAEHALKILSKICKKPELARVSSSRD